MKKKILITGGAGFIGGEIVNQLYSNGEYEITVLDSLSKQIHGENPNDSFLYKKIIDKCMFINADIRDIDAVIDAVADNEIIIHLASETGTGQSMYHINQYNAVNVMGTSNILQSISTLGKSSKVKKIILSSSRSVYGEGKYNCRYCGVVFPQARKKDKMINRDFAMYCNRCNSKLELLPTTEDSKIAPNSLYAFTKYSQEKMLETMCPAMDIYYTIFRFQNVYGIGQSLKNPYTGILSIFSTLLLDNKPINIFEDGMESRDFVNVVDTAASVIKAITIPESNGEIINIGSGKGTSVIEIANTLKKIYNSDSIIKITGDFRIGDIAHNIADITKANNILGFKPTITLQKGLTEFCKWVTVQRIDNSRYEKSLNEMESTGLLIRGGQRNG